MGDSESFTAASSAVLPLLWQLYNNCGHCAEKPGPWAQQPGASPKKGSLEAQPQRLESREEVPGLLPRPPGPLSVSSSCPGSPNCQTATASAIKPLGRRCCNEGVSCLHCCRHLHVLQAGPAVLRAGSSRDASTAPALQPQESVSLPDKSVSRSF